MVERLPKPPHGSPCNRCGACCEAVLCILGEHVFGEHEEGPCPALSFDSDGRSICGLVSAPAHFVRTRAAKVGATVLSGAAGVLIGAGIGCDAQLDGEPADWRFRLKMFAWREEHGPAVAAALKAWGFAKSMRVG